MHKSRAQSQQSHYVTRHPLSILAGARLNGGVSASIASVEAGKRYHSRTLSLEIARLPLMPPHGVDATSWHQTRPNKDAGQFSAYIHTHVHMQRQVGRGVSHREGLSWIIQWIVAPKRDNTGHGIASALEESTHTPTRHRASHLHHSTMPARVSRPGVGVSRLAPAEAQEEIVVMRRMDARVRCSVPFVWASSTLTFQDRGPVQRSRATVPRPTSVFTKQQQSEKARGDSIWNVGEAPSGLCSDAYMPT